MAAETNLITSADLVKAREIEFTYIFGNSIKKLMEALGVTRKIAKQASTVLKAYKATGTLQDGDVAEGDLIPLSKYVTEPVSFEEITLKKWRKATSAEAIIEKGYSQAVTMTTDAMLKDVQKGIRKSFFDFFEVILQTFDTFFVPKSINSIINKFNFWVFIYNFKFFF